MNGAPPAFSDFAAPRTERDVLDALAELRTELLCQANRQPEIDMTETESFLRLVNLAQLEASDVHEAPAAPGRLRTLDAIHLTTVLRTQLGG